MDILINPPSQPIKGTVSLRGSKSISNRILIIQALSGLRFELENLSDSEDTKLLRDALRQIHQPGNREINVNHAGTDFRFLTALLSTGRSTHLLTGSQRLQQRPVGELVDVLRQLGAHITYAGREGFPPLQIRGGKIEGGHVSIRGDISSQFISALLLTAPYFEKGLVLSISTQLVSRPYVEMTIALMQQFGADVHWKENSIFVKPGVYAYNRDTYFIEGDWSSASYWYSIAALSGQCELVLENLLPQSLQSDSIAERLYETFNVHTTYSTDQGKPAAILSKKKPAGLDTFSFDFMDCPDIAQTLACTCAGLGITAAFKGLQTLKIKETDRIDALKRELEKFGAVIETFEDGLNMVQTAKENNSIIKIETYHDHRMAMSFAPLCLAYKSIVIKDAAVVEKSYPHFWKDLEKAGFQITYLS